MKTHAPSSNHQDNYSPNSLSLSLSLALSPARDGKARGIYLTQSQDDTNIQWF